MDESVTENKKTFTPRKPRGPGYSKVERRKIVEELMRGETRETVAERYGLSCSTLKRWQRDAAKRAPRFSKVQIRQEPKVKEPTESLGVLRSPHGYVVDGLSVGGLAELLSRLG